MKQEIHITLRFNLAIGKVTLNEIIYRLKELRDPLMPRILDRILRGYDDLVCERLSQTRIYPSRARKGLGRHIKGGDPDERFCRGRKIKKRGYRRRDRVLSTVFGKLHLPLRVGQCCKCGISPHVNTFERYQMLLSMRLRIFEIYRGEEKDHLRVKIVSSSSLLPLLQPTLFASPPPLLLWQHGCSCKTEQISAGEAHPTLRHFALRIAPF